MQMIPGKLDCTRIRPRHRAPALHIILAVTFTCAFAFAQSAPSVYPEVAYLSRSSYCNPYFGFRLTLPAGFKSEPIYLPVQPHGRHMLLALRLQRLERSAEVFISAFEDATPDPAHLAAKARVQQAREGGLSTSGPSKLSLHDHDIYRLQIVGDTQGPGDESSFYFTFPGHVLHAAIFSHDRELAAPIESAVEHLEFLPPGDRPCSAPVALQADAISALASPAPRPASPAHPYYGPALPTDLVDATIRESPGYSVPAGRFSAGVFSDPAIGLRLALPPAWKPLPAEESYRVTELMRDPTTDTASADRRRALFRACSRVLFAAAEPGAELIPEVHPAVAVVAMPQGCIPDLVPPPNLEDRVASEDFATVMVRSLGVILLARGSIHAASSGIPVFNLDGTLPYQLSGEKLSRRLSLRVTATANGPWLIFIYSVTPNPAAQHQLESGISLSPPTAN